MSDNGKRRNTMKAAAAWAAALALILGGCGESDGSCELYAEDTAAERSGIYTPGDFQASAWGFGGKVTVRMTFSETGILYLRVDGPDESSKGRRAIVRLAHAIMDAQSTEVDAVSGATMTSAAIKKAAGKCFAQASAETDEGEGTE